MRTVTTARSSSMRTGSPGFRPNCAISVASSTATFATSGINNGLFCGTPSVSLGRNVGSKRALDMLFTGQPIDAATALRDGLVSRVVPLDKLMEETLGAALMICDYSQIAVMAAKESVNRAFEGSLSDGVMFERRLFHALFSTQDQKEGMDAFMNKRTANFTHQ